MVAVCGVARWDDEVFNDPMDFSGLSFARQQRQIIEVAGVDVIGPGKSSMR
jgi:hypothetical protein